MALRRPPTRIELKADDVEEYDKVRQENECRIFLMIASRTAPSGE